MPTYEYFCQNCGVFEEFHGMNTSLTNCPKCNGEVRRLISRNNNIIFKGSGFYTTDNRPNTSNKADKDSGSSKPATKSEDKAS